MNTLIEAIELLHFEKGFFSGRQSHTNKTVIVVHCIYFESGAILFKKY